MLGLSLNHFFKDFFFWCGPFLKSLLNLLQYDFCFMFLFLCFGSDLFYVFVSWPRGVRDPSIQTRDQTHTPRSGRQSLNHGITQEVPWGSIFKPVTQALSPFRIPKRSVTLPSCPTSGTVLPNVGGLGSMLHGVWGWGLVQVPLPTSKIMVASLFISQHPEGNVTANYWPFSAPGALCTHYLILTMREGLLATC